jgi:REP element-mobilizing transposase RayT
MAHTYVNCLLHVVFSTRNRAALMSKPWRSKAHDMLASIAHDRGFPTIVVGGVDDHVHLLMSLPKSQSISDCLRVLKATSSKWINDEFFPRRDFAWQEGYGAFAISPSHKEATIAYIENQEEHHRQRTFQDEYRDFLTRQGITWDEQYVWG